MRKEKKRNGTENIVSKKMNTNMTCPVLWHYPRIILSCVLYILIFTWILREKNEYLKYTVSNPTTEVGHANTYNVNHETSTTKMTILSLPPWISPSGKLSSWLRYQLWPYRHFPFLTILQKEKGFKTLLFLSFTNFCIHEVYYITYVCMSPTFKTSYNYVDAIYNVYLFFLLKKHIFIFLSQKIISSI